MIDRSELVPGAMFLWKSSNSYSDDHAILLVVCKSPNIDDSQWSIYYDVVCEGKLMSWNFWWYCTDSNVDLLTRIYI